MGKGRRGWGWNEGRRAFPTSVSMGLRNKNESVASRIKCRQLPSRTPMGAASRVAATYLNKTLDRPAIHPLIRMAFSPTTVYAARINKLSCTERAAVQVRIENAIDGRRGGGREEGGIEGGRKGGREDGREGGNKGQARKVWKYCTIVRTPSKSIEV